MANLDPRFICTSDLELLLRDNASGLPLSGGIVTFYSDVNRTVLKPVYQLTGTPGNYTYAPLNNPCVLSSAGTFQDALGNNIVPYYYPFTGTPAQNTNVQELYYIVVQNSGFVPQFTRQGWPQSAGGGGSSVTGAELINFIPNGQFLANNNAIAMLAPGTQPYVQYSLGSGNVVDAQPIAQGGWNFLYSDGTTATFKNSFSLIPNSGGYAGITSYPRYAFNFQCLSIGDTPTYRDLQISWPDAYKFSAGIVNGVYPTYNLFFNAKSNDSNTYSFTLSIVWYLGGNQTPVVIPIGTISIGSSSYATYNFPITFPTPAGSLSGNNDDYVAIDIKGPSTPWNVSFTDFVLYEGNTALTSFPTDTNAEMLSQGVAGWMPTPDSKWQNGNNLYLPLVLTPQGMTFDQSQVGTVVGKMTTTAVNNELLCDGSTYITTAYSALGIPYSRLQNVLFNSSINIPYFGTGQDFSQIHISSGALSTLILCTNAAGAQTHPSDGTNPTGFNFTPTTNPTNPGSTGYNYLAGSNGVADVTFISNFTSGPALGNGFADSGMTMMSFTQINESQNSGHYYAAYTTALSAGSLANPSSSGLYFTFADTTTQYYLWFKITDEMDPTPGGTGIKTSLSSTMNANDVANIIQCVINGYQTDTISTLAASSIPAGAWFQFFANSMKYVVWYKVGGSGTEPVVASTEAYIQITLAGTETANMVAALTQTAVNTYSFAVPDLRGLFLRGIDPNGTWDLDQSSRFLPSAQSEPTAPGSLEIDQFGNHFHALTALTIPTVNTGGGALNYLTPTGSSATTLTQKAYTVTGNTNNDGGTESRPVNAYVNWFIKY